MTSKAGRPQSSWRFAKAPTNARTTLPFGYPVVIVAAYLAVSLFTLFVIPDLIG